MRYFVLALIATSAWAQWINPRTAGIPRTKDGKPDLSAPAPKTRDGHPDLSGIWVIARRPNPAPAPVVPNASGGGGLRNLLPPGETVPFQPWAEALYKQREASNGKGVPSEHCMPHGIPGGMMIPIPFKILQTPEQLTILWEEFNYYRQIFTDGRGHPELRNPDWFGYSIGKWDRDTMVVDTVGFNDLSWLDVSGYPHTEALHTTERLTRRDLGHMDVLVTIDDPKAYTRPFSPLLHLELRPDFELIEHICDNEKDAVHMVGR